MSHERREAMRKRADAIADRLLSIVFHRELLAAAAFSAVIMCFVLGTEVHRLRDESKRLDEELTTLRSVVIDHIYPPGTKIRAADPKDWK